MITRVVSERRSNRMIESVREQLDICCNYIVGVDALQSMIAGGFREEYRLLHCHWCPCKLNFSRTHCSIASREEMKSRLTPPRHPGP